MSEEDIKQRIFRRAAARPFLSAESTEELQTMIDLIGNCEGPDIPEGVVLWEPIASIVFGVDEISELIDAHQSDIEAAAFASRQVDEAHMPNLDWSTWRGAANFFCREYLGFDCLGSEEEDDYNAWEAAKVAYTNNTLPAIFVTLHFEEDFAKLEHDDDQAREAEEQAST